MDQSPNQPPKPSSKLIIIIPILLVLLIAVGVGLYYFVFKSPAATSEVVSPSTTPILSSKTAPASINDIKAAHCLKTPVKSDKILVSSPADYTLQSAENLKISGTANVFENQFDYRIKDCADQSLASGFVMAEGDMGTNPPYERTFGLTVDKPTDIIIEFYDISAATGKEADLTQIPLRIQ